MSPIGFLEVRLLATSRTRRRPARHRPSDRVAQPRGVLPPRVPQVGPEHFGSVCCDGATARSQFRRADCYGRILLPPTTVAHHRPDLDAAVAPVRATFATHELRDGLVARERTGRYQRLGQRTFAAAGFATRRRHPFVTQPYRQPVDPGHQTDDTDLNALHRATVTGGALLEATREEAWTTLQRVLRHRRDLVGKGAARNGPLRDHREAAGPGYATGFAQLWERALPWHLLRPYPTAAPLRAAGLTTLCPSLRPADSRFQQRTVQAVLDGAEPAAPGAVAAGQHRRSALALYDDRPHKTQELQALERASAGRRAPTPDVRLLAFPGLPGVSAADAAGARGPSEHDANPKSLTGRAGRRPSRYQRDQVDKADGPLVRHGNRSLRAALLGLADHVLLCNHHFQHLVTQ